MKPTRRIYVITKEQIVKWMERETEEVTHMFVNTSTQELEINTKEKDEKEN